MLLAPALGDAPRAIAERLGAVLDERLGTAVERVEVAGPGFLNLFMTDAWYLDALAGVLEAGDGFGAGTAETPEHVQVEFVSANPTGPITVASAPPRRVRRLPLPHPRVRRAPGGARVLRERRRRAGAPLRRVDPRAGTR